MAGLLLLFCRILKGICRKTPIIFIFYIDHTEAYGLCRKHHPLHSSKLVIHSTMIACFNPEYCQYIYKNIGTQNIAPNCMLFYVNTDKNHWKIFMCMPNNLNPVRQYDSINTFPPCFSFFLLNAVHINKWINIFSRNTHTHSHMIKQHGTDKALKSELNRSWQITG